MRNLKKLLAISMLCFSVFSMIDIQANAIEKNMLEDYGIIEVTDVIEIRYKFINGKCYYRAYNTTKKKWIGDWQPA